MTSAVSTTTSAKYEHVLFEINGPIATVTLNRPQRRNALSLELMTELIECLNEIGRNRDIRVVLLRAAGKVFSSGHDLSEMVGRDLNEYRQVFDVCTQLMTRLQEIPQPVIAEVQGIATAADWGLINLVVPAAELSEQTRKLAERIAGASSLTVALGKQAFYTQIDLDQPKAYAYAKEVMSMNSLSADAQEGISAFLEKRSPCWKGK